jgi:uncharacterized membrane protein YbjE (DUF340 family)
MFTVLIIMSMGILAGLLVRNKPKLARWNDRAVNLAIYLLLFLLGVSVGGNKQIMANLGSLGLKALILAVGAIAGSVGLSCLAYKNFFEARK